MARLGLLLLTLALGAAPALAQTVKYVSDDLIITLRSGQSTQHKIIRNIPSGTPLEVLETGEEYSHVRMRDGTEGWALNQYLMSTPPARVRLAEVEQRLTRLETENSRLKLERDELSQRNIASSEEIERLEAGQQQSQLEMAGLREVAAEPMHHQQENERLQKELLMVKSELRMLEEKNHALLDSSNRSWFLIGAGVLLGGMLLGLIIPKIRWRKKSAWGEL